MTIHEILSKNNEALRILKAVWDGRNEGTHGWLQITEELWITFEPEEEDGQDTIWTITTDSVDCLGYPMGEAFDWANLDDGDIKYYERKRKVA